MFECRGRQRWFSVYSFSMARGERWGHLGQVTPSLTHLFSLLQSLALSLAKQIRSQRKGNARDERAKGVTDIREKS